MGPNEVIDAEFEELERGNDVSLVEAVVSVGEEIGTLLPDVGERVVRTAKQGQSLAKSLATALSRGAKVVSEARRASAALGTRKSYRR